MPLIKSMDYKFMTHYKFTSSYTHTHNFLFIVTHTSMSQIIWTSYDVTLFELLEP
jgi:hypothetical protein